ncbi:MAG TPA: acetyl-CoA carboxylase, carboxyltransferase subunit beta [Phycisphaerae bacterium]|nr:acetyl-CoA carboxylase, carboxyltransferase subunit beta [Phycisphaerae bacterium]
MTETSPGSPFQYIPIPEGPPVRKKREMPDGLWMRCDECESTLFRKTVAENMDVCPECGAHFRIGARRRLEQLADPETFEELFAEIAPGDPLTFEWRGQTYAQRIRAEQAKTASTEAVLTGEGYVRGRRVAMGIMDGDFLMGSMGSVVGEKIALLIEHAGERRLPLVIVTTSGGARMHEGALSVMQMGKTAAALGRLDDRKGLFISVLAGPTLGGTTASFAMLGDVILAEPGAMIGFAGTRVIANTIKTELPEGFQRAEFLLAHGFIDRIVARHELRSEIAQLIDLCGK